MPVVALGSALLRAQYGSSSLATTVPCGLPILRMNNLQNDGWDLTDLKYVELSESQQESYRLESGDILFNRTNSKELVGKCEVFREAGKWVFASYLIRVSTDPRKLLPQFASDFLSAPTGRLQIDRLSRQIIGMTNINAEEIKTLLLPLPSLPEQRRLTAAMDAARATRKAKLAEAEGLLTGLDDFVIELLGLEKPQQADRNHYAVKLTQVGKDGKLSADFYHPERVLALRSIESAGAQIAVRPVSEVVEFVRNQIKVPGENYLGLANVQSNTGELVESVEEVAGSCFTFDVGDVLFARLRPYLNKVYRAERKGCCSPEFHVMRTRDRAILLPDYLAAIMRTRLIVAQTVHMMTGNTHPRLANEDVVALRIPVPPLPIQKAIAAEARSARETARRLRAEAEAGWQAAKAQFEAALLGLT